MGLMTATFVIVNREQIVISTKPQYLEPLKEAIRACSSFLCPLRRLSFILRKESFFHKQLVRFLAM